MLLGFVCLLGVCSWMASGMRVHGRDHSLPTPHSTLELGHIRRRMHSRGLADSEILPLYPGYGTHFAYIYVGTPPQRQSVIIDTGSHYTAFPCTGCSQCGQHTDNYFNPDNSSTAEVLKCNNVHCTITQSYSEGSSWHAYKVVDKLWVGGLTVGEVPNAESMAIPFPFGCQTSESGLFRTQLADGIMGFSMHEDTLPYKLVESKLTTSKMFALCFRVGGGILTLGGVDQRIHLKQSFQTPVIQYTNMTSSNGWYAIELLDVQIQKQNSMDRESLGGTPQQYCGGKGCIVDSGTTDTYLPSALGQKFMSLFNKVSGVKWSTGNVLLSTEQLNAMPNLVFVFRGSDGNNIEVEMPWTSYVDSVGGGKYAFRVYLTENSGTVLGANFMNGHNIVFDPDGMRIGFARSNCKYEDYALTAAPTFAPTKMPVLDRQDDGDDADDKAKSPVIDCTELIPYSYCSASCDENKGSYVAAGNQTYVQRCSTRSDGSRDFVDKPCHVPCNGHRLGRGAHPECADSVWSQCTKAACTQSKVVSEYNGKSVEEEDSGKTSSGDSTNSNNNKNLHRGMMAFQRQSHRHSHRRRLADASSSSASKDTCINHTVSRSCYTDNCPLKDGDYIVLLDLMFNIDPYHWSYVHEENFFGAFEALFGVPSSSMQLLNDISREYTLEVKLHFELRLRKEDYNSMRALADAAQEITLAVYEPGFGLKLLAALDKVAYETDKIDYSRYGWMREQDLRMLNAFAIPIGNERPFDYEIDDKLINNSSNSYGSLNMFLAFIAVSALAVMVVVLCMYYRLQREHQQLHKRKSMGGSLHQMWNRFTNARNSVLKRARDAVAGNGTGGRRTAAMSGTYTGDRSYLETDASEVQMSRWSAAGDDQIDEEDYR